MKLVYYDDSRIPEGAVRGYALASLEPVVTGHRLDTGPGQLLSLPNEKRRRQNRRCFRIWQSRASIEAPGNHRREQ